MRFDGEDLAGLTMAVGFALYLLTPPLLLIKALDHYWPQVFRGKWGRVLWHALLWSCVMMWWPITKMMFR
jgi:hypothetical protein